MLPDLRRVVPTTHCLDRYRERARPGLTLAQAHVELTRLLPLGRLAASPPPWLAPESAPAPFYVVVADSLAFPLAPGRGGRWSALTCLGRGGLSPQVRERRNRRARDRRMRRRRGDRFASGRRPIPDERR